MARVCLCGWVGAARLSIGKIVTLVTGFRCVDKYSGFPNRDTVTLVTDSLWVLVCVCRYCTFPIMLVARAF